MGIVDQLLAQPGLYLGTDQMEGSDRRGVSRMVVTALPGGAGVALDYEVLLSDEPGRVQGHAEHTMIGSTHDGPAFMVIGHTHADALTVLEETEPGVFELGDRPSPYPVKVVVSVPAPGRIRHSWWYGSPGEAPVERDVSEVERLG